MFPGVRSHCGGVRDIFSLLLLFFPSRKKTALLGHERFVWCVQANGDLLPDSWYLPSLSVDMTATVILTLRRAVIVRASIPDTYVLCIPEVQGTFFSTV